MLYTFGFAAGFLFFFNLVPGELLPMGGGQFAAATAGSLANFFWLDGVLAGWGILFLLAAGPTLAGFGIYNMSLGLLPSSVANLVLTLEPAFTAVIAYFLLGEMLTAVQIGGSLLIMAGVAFLRLYEGWLEAQPAVAGVIQREDPSIGS